MITSEVHSDDHAKKAKFDATSWFEQATDKEITELAQCEWGGDYPADEVARFCDKQAGVTEVLEWTEDHDGIGFECEVDEKEAMKWLRQNKPDLASQLDPGWGEYDTPQDVCPGCDSDDISNEDGPDDLNRLPVTCHNCGYQWHEPNK